MESCEIAVSRINVGRAKSDWIFEARDSRGEPLYSTTPFKSQTSFVFRGKNEFAVLDSFVKRLERDGWVIIWTPPQDQNGDWYRVRLAKGTPQNIQSLMAIEQMKRPQTVERRPWLTAQKMWLFSVFILVVLVMCCLVLIYTSELRMSPA